MKKTHRDLDPYQNYLKMATTTPIDIFFFPFFQLRSLCWDRSRHNEGLFLADGSSIFQEATRVRRDFYRVRQRARNCYHVDDDEERRWVSSSSIPTCLVVGNVPIPDVCLYSPQ